MKAQIDRGDDRHPSIDTCILRTMDIRKHKQKTHRWTRTRSGLPNLSGVALTDSSVIHHITHGRRSQRYQRHSDALHDAIRCPLPHQHNRRVSNRQHPPHCQGLAVPCPSPSIPPATPTSVRVPLPRGKGGRNLHNRATCQSALASVRVLQGRSLVSRQLKIVETCFRQTVLPNDSKPTFSRAPLRNPLHNTIWSGRITRLVENLVIATLMAIPFSPSWRS
jgi:hypothetical protein